MAAQILITCPECKKQLKGPAELQGKRVRCKGCGKVFAVRAPAASKTSAAPKKTAGVPAAKAKTAPRAPEPPEEETSKNPYGLSDIVNSTRCPQCAAAMESEDAVICLNCGYHTVSRQRITTVRTYAHTPLDWAIWLAPGIACALAVLTLLGLIAFFWIPAGMVSMAGNTWWGYQWGPVQIYGSVVAAGAAYFIGKFAFRRLVKNPRPPEKFKKLSDE